MPLEDGTNAEKEDPEPPLGWTSKDDIKDCKVYGQSLSPPCFKIMLFLKHYDIPFELVSADAGKGITKESSYKKIPVMTASGRTINDSSVIVHQLLAACGGDAFDKEQQEEITFGLQPAIEVDVLACAADFKKIALKAGFPVWCVPEFVLGGLMGEKISESIKAKNPDMKPSLDYGKAFKAQFPDTTFHGGDDPDQVDISYYGTVAPFHVGEGCVVEAHLADAGLAAWYEEMLGIMPIVD